MKKIVALFTLLSVGILTIILFLPQFDDAQRLVPSAEGWVVLLAPHGYAKTIPNEVLSNASTTIIVHNFATLKATSEQQRPLAILIERSLLSTVENTWLTERYNLGIPIAGIDVEADELKSKLGLPGNGYQIPPFIESPYLLYIYYRAESGLTSKGDGVVPLFDYDSFITFLQESDASFHTQLQDR